VAVCCVGAFEFGRRVLLCNWEAMLDILSVLTNGRSCAGVSSSLAAAVMFAARDDNRRVRQAICTSLAGLQKAARLSSALGRRFTLLRFKHKFHTTRHDNDIGAMFCAIICGTAILKVHSGHLNEC